MEPVSVVCPRPDKWAVGSVLRHLFLLDSLGDIVKNQLSLSASAWLDWAKAIPIVVTMEGAICVQ